MNKELITNIINWSNPEQLITPNFSVNEILTLHAWNRLGSSADGADFEKLTLLCQKMEQVREILGCGINVHCAFRSVEYNKSQGINPNLDAHAKSLAMDFDCGEHWTIEEIQQLLEPKLEELEIRMERNTTSWCHIDLLPPGITGRYFTA